MCIRDRDESFRERFVREFRLVAGINHPNILPVYDAGVWQDSLYIAMRYVAGGTLKTRVQEGPLAPDRALSMLAHVRHRLRPRQFLRTGRSPAPDGSSGSHRDAKRQLPVGATPAMRMRHLVRTESTEARLVANEKSKPLLTGTKSPRSSVDRAAVS